MQQPLSNCLAFGVDRLLPGLQEAGVVTDLDLLRLLPGAARHEEALTVLRVAGRRLGAEPLFSDKHEEELGAQLLIAWARSQPACYYARRLCVHTWSQLHLA
ncbi:unnamed protein product [Polarella glacialis]|uniref:Uncharacterized protein n=1 Tax=Polarella glacialis TaxID=89957 RepID=A0A813EK47_POLGL|nr:unnamed protein product [Polarella glacialis]